MRRAALSLLVTLAWASAASALEVCRETAVHLRGPSGVARFSVEVADSDAERAQGLMFREKMARGAGMLFIYPRPQAVSFWMRNTLIPLDMIFVDSTGLVKRVHENAVPGDETPISGGEGILVVLEINAGLAQALGIVPGSQMRHAVFGLDALWPC
ncbi:MAG TPA: hypothetical protein DEF12_00860 [Rhodobacteraceae bacterium]|jgi:uncharacterized membrane protein (UPF0127 family)|nr:hypothetical protein [Paracoccaceae bacterium]HBV53569.1 hypothetical protein [Paracoccaceae bacterium]